MNRSSFSPDVRFSDDGNTAEIDRAIERDMERECFGDRDELEPPTVHIPRETCAQLVFGRPDEDEAITGRMAIVSYSDVEDPALAETIDMAAPDTEIGGEG